MQSTPFPKSLVHALRPARLVSALGLMTAVLLAACSADSATAPHSPAGSASRSVVALSATTLGSASTFAVLGASAVTCTGGSSNSGDVGIFPGSTIIGFNPDCTLAGGLHIADDASTSAQADAATAYGSLSAATCDVNYGTAQELSGLTLNAGVYCFPSSAFVTGGTLTLNGPGPFIFKIASTFITSAGSVILTGGATCDDVYYLVGSSATIAGPVAGNILAYASISLDSGASLSGRAIALNAAVTLSGQNTVSACR